MPDRNYVYLVDPKRDPALMGWQAALANRNNKRANVVLIGPSQVEGFPMTDFDKTTAQILSQMLRAKYPTSGIGRQGGRGRVGIPNQGITPAIPSPFTFTGGTFDPAAYGTTPTNHAGANHTCWYTSTNGNKVTFTLKAWETSFDIVRVNDVGGHATAGYYKINGGASTSFSTYSATRVLATTHVDVVTSTDEWTIDGGTPSGLTTVEIGCSGTGLLILSEILINGGDENLGIQAHGVGHYGYRALDLANSPAAVAGWRDSLVNLSPDVIVIELGYNDAVSSTAATYATNLATLIANIRAANANMAVCPFLLSAPYNAKGGLSFMEPWDYYTAQMRTIADADPLVAFVNEADYMPATDDPYTYALYHSDLIHGNANGKAYSSQAHLIAEALSFG